ncbi:coiled-coil domain-containing protein 15 [Theristicus caerulescens]
MGGARRAEVAAGFKAAAEAEVAGRTRRGAGMVPPSKERRRGAGEQPGGRRARPPRQSWRVLAERNQSVAPVGVWVESGPGQPEESLAFASAFQVEEELKEQQREKAASLRRFQGEVKQRVNQQVRMRRKQQLQKSYEAAERESCVAVQYSDSALRLTPRKNTCLFRSHPTPAICARAVPAQRQEGTRSEPFQQQAAKLSKTVKQVRRRLASCKTVHQGAGPPELPGGVWRRERQNEYLRYRRLFMTVEREQVKEQQRQKERQKRIAEIKRKKENQRRAEERRMQARAEPQEASLGEGACETLAQLQLEEKRAKKRKENQERNKEYARYIEALRAQMREKIKLYNIDLPPLCSCGSDFWDSHPDTCANNCGFYKNPKAYSRALQSLVSSCDPADRSRSARLPLRGLAALCARSGKHP